MRQPALYIMTNKAKGTLYTGVTSNLKNRMWGLGLGSLAIRTSSLTNLGNGSIWVLGTFRFAQPTKLVSYLMDSRLRRPPPSFPRRRESITVRSHETTRALHHDQQSQGNTLHRRDQQPEKPDVGTRTWQLGNSDK